MVSCVSTLVSLWLVSCVSTAGLVCVDADNEAETCQKGLDTHVDLCDTDCEGGIAHVDVSCRHCVSEAQILSFKRL